MKKLLGLILVMMLVVPGVSFAADSLFGTIIEAIPNTTTGGFYDFVQHDFSMIVTGELLKKDTKYGTLSLDAGYGESNLGVAGISYKTETLEKVGVKVVLLKDLFAKVGYACGIDGITDGDKRFVHGPMVTFGANFKF